MAILNKRIQEQADAIDNHIIDALKSGNSFIVEAGRGPMVVVVSSRV